MNENWARIPNPRDLTSIFFRNSQLVWIFGGKLALANMELSQFFQILLYRLNLMTRFIVVKYSYINVMSSY